jgi:hypothetical protein
MNNFSRLEALDAENVPIIVENRLTCASIYFIQAYRKDRQRRDKPAWSSE